MRSKDHYRALWLHISHCNGGLITIFCGFALSSCRSPQFYIFKTGTIKNLKKKNPETLLGNYF
jgi:hypothetical protein